MPPHQRLRPQTLRALQGARVAIVGDIMLDHYVFGSAERISPEAPVPVVRARHETDMLGGAGNVLRNLAALEASPALVGVVGTDRTGARITELLAQAGAPADSLVIDPARPSTAKTRFLSGSHAMLRVDWEDETPLSARDQGLVVARVEELVGQSDALVLSDYGKGVLSGDMAPRLIAAARASKLPVLVDPKGTDWTRYTGASVITPNRNELCAAAGLPRGSSLDAMLDGCRRLIETLDLQAIVLTRSEEGLSVVSAGDAEPHHIAAVAREVSDVSGAGDTVVAVLAAALAGGLTLRMAAEIANVAAGIVVAKVGAATATLPEIRRALDSAAPDPAMEDIDAKVMDLATAAVRVQEWSAAGLRVGFTNGCFDLLHPGHVRMLAAARRACDRLVVGLNTDASVTRLKGPSRPIQDADARGAVLSGLASVNAVVTFAEDTPLELITALRPSVLFKGADYRMEDVVGGAFVRSIGGQVLLLDLVPNSSTTRIVERARTLGANPKG